MCLSKSFLVFIFCLINTFRNAIDIFDLECRTIVIHEFQLECLVNPIVGLL
ncbi:hypothetical protein T03_13516 [Trichinella britovi]|uniref:Uncharacterized protein n=1 Tax=Trichinella britovi TaxID=45882 RepID=A0A0V0YZV9_TRIBR|nr:hypothetical protein T03_9369 [Trichinella britovi]KRY25520.1 hypothetical protein T03_13516 [Trichinella britovi]